ncbi:DUF1573 domain-containing protein [Chitinispirillales bacterium ANBcel5]|uniref:DUF1573 domain-containing protein n=1 Tax=Cellulosispirillum alkaliphilum TaxID=3039283 RepID=UPI002A525750|nr:DUF1573 domain-containing protein [Chitinispirillales bacterium ANBcel5]
MLKFLLLSFTLGVTTAFATPQIEVSPEIYEFGIVEKINTSKANAIFMIENTGSSPLVIESVRPSCGCAVVEYDSLVMPGESSKLEVEIDFDQFNGPVQSSVTIISDAQNSSVHRVTMKADVIPIIDLSEWYISLTGGKPYTLYLSTEKKDLSISEVRFILHPTDYSAGEEVYIDHKLVSAETNQSEKRTTYELSLTPDSVKENSSGIFILHTNHPYEREITIPGRVGVVY